MPHQCTDIEKFGDIAALAPDDPQRQAVEACPHCRALFKTYNAFMDAEPAPGSRPAEADDQLGAFLEERIAATTSQPATAAAPKRSWWAALTAWQLAPVATAAVLIIALAVWAPWRAAGPSLERAGDGSAIELNEAQVTADTVMLSWSAHPEATGYRIVLYRPDLTEIVRTESGGETATTFQINQLDEPGDGNIIWRVFVLVDGDEVFRSSPGVFELP